MADAPIIATCCYCGSTNSLVLRGDVRHELACQRCGAPIRRLKALPIERLARAPAPEQTKKTPSRKKSPPRKRRSEADDKERSFRRDRDRDVDRERPRRRAEPPRPDRRRRPKRRSTFGHVLRELIDEFEDFFD